MFISTRIPKICFKPCFKIQQTEFIKISTQNSLLSLKRNNFNFFLKETCFHVFIFFCFFKVFFFRNLNIEWLYCSLSSLLKSFESMPNQANAQFQECIWTGAYVCAEWPRKHLLTPKWLCICLQLLICRQHLHIIFG